MRAAIRVAPWLAVGVLSGCAAIQKQAGIETDEAAGATTEQSSQPSTVSLPPGVVIQALQVTGPAVPDPLDKPLPEAPYASAWDRMRSGFRLPDYQDRLIQQHRDYFADRPDYMARVSERAQPWIHYILDAIDARDMPTELALVPVVESAFRPFAYSHGRAAGIWQIVPGTARYMGLKRNWWFDGRRDVVTATDAALDYLERLEGRFDGDWLLALAAYNAGEGTVLQAMRRNRRAGERTDFWHLDLPTETERYVPRILALRDLINNPSAYGLAALPELRNEPGVAVIDMDHQIDLARAADMADVSIETLYRLNPGFNRWATPPEGPHRLVVPADKEGHFRERLAATEPDERMQWRRHEVARGETLLEIADAYQTSVEVIREANDITGNTIRAGQGLIVPVASRPPEDYALSATQRLASAQATPRDGQRTRYTVRQGDSFWEIARRYGVGVRELASWNGMSPNDTLQPGQELVVWSESGTTSADTGSSNATDNPSGEPTQYTVRQGDNLWAIAKRFDVGVQEIAEWNGISTEAKLRPGDELAIWTDDDTSESQTASSSKAAGDNQSDPSSVTSYTVRKGDSLYRIAREFGVTISQLRQWNDISADSYLQPGQTLRMQLEREGDS